MLIPDFYTIQKAEIVGEKLQATLVLNPDHGIFKGHFPGQPVVPGVIQLQVIKELLEAHLNYKLQLTNMSQAKFLMMIIPDKEPLTVTLSHRLKETGYLHVDGEVSRGSQIFTKVKADFQRQEVLLK